MKKSHLYSEKVVILCNSLEMVTELELEMLVKKVVSNCVRLVKIMLALLVMCKKSIRYGK